MTLENSILTLAELSEMQELSSGTFVRATDCLEAIRNAIDAISLGSGTATLGNQNQILDGTAGDFVATEDSLHDIRSAIGRTIITGAVSRRLEDTPYFGASGLSIIKAPTVDQPSMLSAYQSLYNINGALPTTAEITPGTADIDRFRDGTDADWVAVLAASALTEANGIVRIAYTFPAASWQVGDLVRVRFTGTSIILGGKTVTLPDAFGFTQIIGLVAADSTGTTFPEYVIGNKADAAQTDGGATRSIVSHVKGILTRLNDATFGLSGLETRLDGIEGAGFVTATDSLRQIRINLGTVDTNVSTALTRIGTPAVSLTADHTTIDGALNVPAGADDTNDVRSRDVLGRKSDTTIGDTVAFSAAGGFTLSRAVKTLQRTEKLVIQDTDLALAAIDTTLVVSPNGSNTPDVANTVLSLNFVTGTSYTLENLIVQITSLGTGTVVTLGLWCPLNGVVTQIKTVTIGSGPPTHDYATSEIFHLMDLFGLPRITADSIHVTAIVDVGVTAALSATYNYGTWRIS